MLGKIGIRLRRAPVVIVVVVLINGILAAEIRHKKTPAETSSVVKNKGDQSDGRRILYRNVGSDLDSEETGVVPDIVKAESHGVRGYEDSEYEHVATYSKQSNALNPVSVIAISIFGVLTLLLILQLLGVQTFRSLSSSPLSIINLPIEWSFNSEMIPEIMTKVIDVMERLEQKGANSSKRSRPKRELGQAPSILEWMSAYKKDPNEYECVRKLACNTLSHSPLVAQSMKSKIGSTIMSSIKFFFDDGTMLVETIKDVLQDPDKCLYLFSDYCDEPKSNPTTSAATPAQKNRV